MGLIRTVDATIEPVTVAEAKTHLLVEHSRDDTLIGGLITAARQECENLLQRSLLEQTWQKTIDFFPIDIELPYPRIISVSSVQYVDSATGTTSTLSSDSYQLDSASEPGWLVPAYGYDWPVPRDVMNAVTVTYKAGYGTSASSVPEAIKAWIKLMVGHLYENREASTAGVAVARVPYIDALLDPYRIVAVP